MLSPRRHVVRHIRVPPDLDRPALAGVELVAPLPLPAEPPHIVVQLPAYPLDSFATAFTTPPPPIVCHRTHRDPDAPDPRLYREGPVESASRTIREGRSSAGLPIASRHRRHRGVVHDVAPSRRRP